MSKKKRTEQVNQGNSYQHEQFNEEEGEAHKLQQQSVEEIRQSYLYFTPPVRGSNVQNLNLKNAFHVKAVNKQGELDSEEESVSESDEGEQSDSVEEGEKDEVDKQQENEPDLKKARVISSHKILFQENTLPQPEAIEKDQPFKAIFDQKSRGGDVLNKNMLKFNMKASKKISKITDYLNSDILQNKPVNIPINNNPFGEMNILLNRKNMLPQKNGETNAVEVIASLQKQLKEKTAQQNEKDKIIQDLEAQLAKFTNQKSMKSSSSNLATKITSSASFDTNKVRKIIQKQYLENSSLKRKLLKMQLQQTKQRLGEYIMQFLQNDSIYLVFIQKSDGSTFKEQWMDGFEVQDICSQLKDVEKKMEAHQNAYQALKNAKQKKTTKPGVSGKQQGQQQKQLNFQNEIVSRESSSQQDSNNFSIFEDDISFDNSAYPNQAVALEEQKRLSLFQFSLLQKQKEVLVNSLDIKKKEIKEVIKQYQLQYLEENSRFGGISVPDAWPVLGNRYQLLSLLGKGGFSEVYKAIDLEEFREVAVKVHYIDKQWSNSTKKNYLKHAVREHGIQKELDHPNIVKLYDCIEMGSSFASVLQFCDGCDLSQHLKLHTTMIEQDAKYIVKKVLDCLSYLNSFQSRVIHYDLKPQNIIFNKGQVKITDFGLSKILEDNATRLELTSQGVGTYWYLPPECFGCEGENSPQISSKVDIWSVGVIFFEMLFGSKPFGNKMSQQQILQQNTILNSKEVSFPSKPIVSKDCQSFILGCLKYNQDERFDITQALNHNYFKKQ